MSKICFGCGIKLQSSDINSLGYVPEEKLKESEYCQRCFKMMHYGEVKKAEKPKSTKAIINAVNKNAEFVVFMVDFINIYDKIIDIYKAIRVPKVLLVAKSDIIPKNISFSTIKSYLRKVYCIEEDILFTSSIGTLNALIKELHDYDEIYFLGLTNTGKSTIINKIVQKSGSKVNPIATSFKKNTTLDFLRVKIDGKTFVDSPGFVCEEYDVDKNTKIDSEIHPITYQNKTECIYKIGEEFALKIKGNANVIFYFSNNIKIKRLYKKEVSGDMISIAGKKDIVISGLGFIKTTKDIEVTIPKDIMKYVYVRPSLVGGTFE